MTLIAGVLSAVTGFGGAAILLPALVLLIGAYIGQRIVDRTPERVFIIFGGGWPSSPPVFA